MSYETEASAIQNHFATAWAGRTPVGYDGLNFNASDGSVQIDVLNAQAMQMSIGAPGQNVARYVGVVAVRVYTSAGRSTVHSRAIEDDVAEIFRNVRVGNILFRIPYTSGNEVKDNWRVRTVMCPFSRDEYHA